MKPTLLTLIALLLELPVLVPNLFHPRGKALFVLCVSMLFLLTNRRRGGSIDQAVDRPQLE